MTDEQGTTRDIIEQELYIGTTLVTLIDTAGLRKTENKAEIIGIKKSYNEISDANIIIIVDDQNPQQVYENIKTLVIKKSALLVHNKVDLLANPKKNKLVYNLSCKKESGFDVFFTELLTLCNKEIATFNTQHLYLLNQRQRHLLEKINLSLIQLIKDQQQAEDLSVCLSGLYIIRDYFNALMEPPEKEGVLHSIFKGFCVGK